MGSGYLHLLVLAAIALFLIMRLRKTLGTRDGFEPEIERNRVVIQPTPQSKSRGDSFELDQDIADHVPLDSPSGKALSAMKVVEPDFSVSEFMNGARYAYEIILMAFEGDDLDTLKRLLSQDVYASFEAVVLDRQKKGFQVEANFIGVREAKLESATFDKRTEDAEITVSFVGELTSVVRLPDGEIVEGDPRTIRKQKNVWTFSRVMGDEDPNWFLVDTAE